MNEDEDIEQYGNKIILNKSFSSIDNTNHDNSHISDEVLKQEIEHNTSEKQMKNMLICQGKEIQDLKN